MDLESQAADFLASHRTASLATVDAQQHPHGANIQYVHDPDLCLYWVSSPDSAHSQHLLSRPCVALTIYDHDDAALQIHGLQMRGHAQPLTDSTDRMNAQQRYLSKFTDLANHPNLCAAVDAQTFYRFTPTWLRWIDNRRGFGFKIEKQWP